MRPYNRISVLSRGRDTRGLTLCLFLLSPKWRSGSCSIVSDSLLSHGLYSPWKSPGQNTGVGSGSLLQGIFLTQAWTHVSHTASRFFTNWATRGAQETGVGSLSLLQHILPTQELNQGLAHCWGILYQLSFQGNPLLSLSICLSVCLSVCLSLSLCVCA